MEETFSAEIYYKPYFELKLNEQIVDLLMRQSNKHYDMTCREASKQSGFIYGWKNCVEFKVTCGANFRQLDLTLKILENFCGALEEAKLQLEYTTFIRGLLEKSNQKTVLMPSELTAENGAKYLLSGEFKESKEIACVECDPRDLAVDCELCNGSGTLIDDITISWNNIKSIYALAVEKLSMKKF